MADKYAIQHIPGNGKFHLTQSGARCGLIARGLKMLPTFRQAHLKRKKLPV